MRSTRIHEIFPLLDCGKLAAREAHLGQECLGRSRELKAIRCYLRTRGALLENETDRPETIPGSYQTPSKTAVKALRGR